MTTAWENYHRRAAMMRRIQQRIEQSPTGDLPWDATIAQVFADREDLLIALHQVWSNRLAAQVELALETDCESVTESVVRARRDLGYRFPGLRRILDSYADDPALAHFERVEHRLLAVAAGLATLDDPMLEAAAAGARLADMAAAAVPAA